MYLEKPDDKCLYTMKNEEIGHVVVKNVSKKIFHIHM